MKDLDDLICFLLLKQQNRYLERRNKQIKLLMTTKLLAEHGINS